MRYYYYREFMDSKFPIKIEVKRNDSFPNNAPHSHEYFQICYVMKGTCLHIVNGKKAVLVKGDMFSVPPDYEHALEFFPGKEAEIAHIDFMPFLLDRGLVNFSNMKSLVNFIFIQPFVEMNDQLLPKLNLSFSCQREVENLIVEMMKELQLKMEGYQLVVKSNLQKLLVIAGREYDRFIRHKREHGMMSVHHKSLEEAVAFIKEKYMFPIKLQDVAARAAMSPTYFSALFKLIYGKTFTEYLNETRLKEAMRLLQQTDRSVEDISLSTGYNHLTHFHRMFKKMTGVTPREYRKKSSLQG